MSDVVRGYRAVETDSLYLCLTVTYNPDAVKARSLVPFYVVATWYSLREIKLC